MVEHHIQKHILHVLAHTETANFASLRPLNTDSNVFTYHIKQLLKTDLITKLGKEYTLTPEGKRMDKSFASKRTVAPVQAYSVLFVVVKSANGKWLLRKRLNQPMLGKIGFVHSAPYSGQNVTISCENHVKKITGQKVMLQVKGSGFVETESKLGTESYLNFTVMYGTTKDVSLDLATDEDNEYGWHTAMELKNLETVPYLQPVLDHINDSKKLFFLTLKMTF